MGNRGSRHRLEGDNVATSKRKRDGSDVDELRRVPKQPMRIQAQHGIVPLDNDSVPSLSTMPESVLLHILSFALTTQRGLFHKLSQDTFAVQIALEKTCHRFSDLLSKDSTMRLLYEGQPVVEFDYHVDSEREKMFIQRGLGLIRRFQNGGDPLLCDYMGGADGVRSVIDKMLIKMEQPRHDEAPSMVPPQFPENGFELFLRGDSIAYLTEVIEQHMICRLNNACSAAMFRSNPPSSHPYPMVRPHDLSFVDSIRTSDFGARHFCTVGPQDEPRNERHCCSRQSFSATPKMWKWPDDNCIEEEILGTEQRQRMVRAIASRAGIVKLSGAAFDCIAAEILHFMATIVTDAFETSKSLWCHHTNVGVSLTIDENEGLLVSIVNIDDTINAEDDRSLASSENKYEVDYFNQPPPPVITDEEGRTLCVIIPRQIEDAAVRLGMKPLLDGYSWKVSEGRTRDEEIEEAMLMYDSSSDEDSVDEAGSGEEDDDESVCDCPHCIATRMNEVANDDVDNAVNEADDEENGGDAKGNGQGTRNGDLDNHASEEDDANMRAVEVVEVGANEKVVDGNDDNLGENNDEDDMDSHSSLSY